MKTKAATTILTLLFLLAAFTQSQAGGDKKVKSGTLVVHTSAVCDMCEATIVTAVKKIKGVKKASLDVPSKNVTIIYSLAKTDPATIRKAIAAAGYDADDIPADQEAYDNLDPCCKKGAH